MPEVAIERKADGTPVDPYLAAAEREGRVSYGRPTIVSDLPKLEVVNDDVQQLQAANEGVVIDGDFVEFMGEKFKMGERIGLMPLLKFAHVSSKGVNAGDMEGLAAMYALIRDCIAADQWERFEQTAIEKQAEDTDLLDVVAKTIEALSARPTQRRSGSSSGSPTTQGSSKVSSTVSRAPEGLEPLR